MNYLTVNIKKLSKNAIIPKFSHADDSGADVYSIDDVVINAGEKALIHTGLAIELPDGYECQVRSKSGLALHSSIFVLNSPGTIDHGYRGECNVILMNLGKEPYHVKVGQKIAQFVFKPIFQVKFKEKSDLSDTCRGDGGFGSTGIQ